MGLNSFSEKLNGIEKLAIDTAPFIYFVEANPAYEALVNEAFQRIDNGKLTGLTSILTLTKALIFPLQNGLEELASTYRQILLGTAGVQAIEMNAAIAELARHLACQVFAKSLENTGCHSTFDCCFGGLQRHIDQ